MRDATDITVLLDRSGSMVSIKTDMIGGFNTLVDEQKRLQGECRMTLVQFDSQDPQEVVFSNMHIADVPALTDKTFQPRGGTPYFDALAKAVQTTGERLRALSERERPDKVIFVVITDGEENSSREFRGSQVRDMVQHQESTYKWHFIFLGANQDALKNAREIGISGATAANFAINSASVRSAYTYTSANIANLRTGVSQNLAYSDSQREDILNGVVSGSTSDPDSSH